MTQKHAWRDAFTSACASMSPIGSWWPSVWLLESAPSDDPQAGQQTPADIDETGEGHDEHERY